MVANLADIDTNFRISNPHCVERKPMIKLAPREHLQFAWYPWREAADRCFSMTNVAAIRALAERGLIGNG